MAMGTVQWTETISRGLTQALMQNFASVSEALKELVDNAVNYQWGQKLDISIIHDKRHDRVVVESDGGRGMGAEEIQTWLNWGQGEKHAPTDISRWHQGGKAACGFLGRHLRIWAKRQGSDEIWYLQDRDWATREENKNFGVARPLPKNQYPATLNDLPKGRGHVRIEVTNLREGKRWRLEDLRRNLSSTYRTLLMQGDLHITIGTEPLAPLDIPLSTALKRLELDVRISGSKRADGWAAKMSRDQLTRNIKPGLRLLHSGRLIKENEWFGYNYEGKGALSSLVGELRLVGFTPNLHKTDFVERGDEVWESLGSEVLKQLAPLIAKLRQSGEETRVTRREKELAGEVAQELERVLSGLRDTPGESPSVPPDNISDKVGPGGRKKAQSPVEPRPQVVNPRGPNKNPPTPQTPPPTDSVGELERLIQQITEDGKRVPLRVRGWDPTIRSAWTVEGKRVWLDVNKTYPLYLSLNGVKPYVAETAVLEYFTPRNGTNTNTTEYLEKVNLTLLRWAQLVSQQVE